MGDDLCLTAQHRVILDWPLGSRRIGIHLQAGLRQVVTVDVEDLALRILLGRIDNDEVIADLHLTTEFLRAPCKVILISAEQTHLSVRVRRESRLIVVHACQVASACLSFVALGHHEALWDDSCVWIECLMHLSRSIWSWLDMLRGSCSAQLVHRSWKSEALVLNRFTFVELQFAFASLLRVHFACFISTSVDLSWHQTVSL